MSTPLKTNIDRSAESFRANAQSMRGLVDDLKSKLATIAHGGGVDLAGLAGERVVDGDDLAG